MSSDARLETRRASIRGEARGPRAMARRRQGLRRDGRRWDGDDGTTHAEASSARECSGAYLSLSDLRRHRARAAVAGNAVPRTLRRPRARRCAHNVGGGRPVVVELGLGFQWHWAFSGTATYT